MEQENRVGMQPADRRRRFAGDLLDLTSARGACVWLMLIALPALIALTVLIAPFQALDEASHYYRAVQLSEGHVLPKVSPQHNAAGDDLDASVRRLGAFYNYLAYTDWKGVYAESADDARLTWALRPDGRRAFTAFSNTVIYFPIAHAAPAAVIAVMRRLGAPPIAWLYGGRLIDAALAIAIFTIAICWCGELRVLILILALVPRTLFGTAALSADALLVPFAALYAAGLLRLRADGKLSRAGTVALIASGTFIGISKIAYIPLVILGPAIALLRERRVTRTVLLLSAWALLTVAVWGAWAFAIRHSVFPIRAGVPVDVYAQLHGLLGHPARAVAVLLNSLRVSGLGYLDSLVGSELGSHQVRIPYRVVAPTLLLLCLSAFVAPRAVPAQRRELALTLVVAVSVSLAIFLLLYMQNTPLGFFRVNGVQGRYFLPLIASVAAFLPKFNLATRPRRLFSILLICWLAASSVFAVELFYTRYRTSPPNPSIRFGNPALLRFE